MSVENSEVFHDVGGMNPSELCSLPDISNVSSTLSDEVEDEVVSEVENVPSPEVNNPYDIANDCDKNDNFLIDWDYLEDYLQSIRARRNARRVASPLLYPTSGESCYEGDLSESEEELHYFGSCDSSVEDLKLCHVENIKNGYDGDDEFNISFEYGIPGPSSVSTMPLASLYYSDDSTDWNSD